jgi:uncharacterized membrane protein YphA (DoxX/SURF4 family)
MKNLFLKAQPWIGTLARITLGGVLFVAGYLKAGSPDKSQMAVRAYEVLPISLANPIGLVLPYAEVALGLLLILGVYIKVSAALGGAIMVVFIAAISQAWARGLTIDCGCFGGGGQVAANETKYLSEILRDTGLVLLAIYLFRYPSTRFAVEKQRNRETGNSNG